MGYQRCVRCSGEGEVVESGFQMTCPECKGFRVVAIKVVPAEKPEATLVDFSDIHNLLDQAREVCTQRASYKEASQSQRVAKRIAKAVDPVESLMTLTAEHNLKIGQSLALKAFEGIPLSPNENRLLRRLHRHTRSNVAPECLQGRLPFKTLVFNAGRQSGKSTLLGHYLKWTLKQLVHQDVRKMIPPGQQSLEILHLTGIPGAGPSMSPSLLESKELRPHIKSSSRARRFSIFELATSDDLDRKDRPSIRVVSCAETSLPQASLASAPFHLVLADETTLREPATKDAIITYTNEHTRTILAGSYRKDSVPQAFDDAFEYALLEPESMRRPNVLVVSLHTHEARETSLTGADVQALSWTQRVEFKASQAEIQTWREALEDEGLFPETIEMLLAKVGRSQPS